MADGTFQVGRIPTGWTRGESVILIRSVPTIQWKRAHVNPFEDAADCVKLITFSTTEQSNAWMRWWFA